MTIDEGRFEIASSNTHYDLSKHILILPCVSIGSVPQLAIDALLEPSNAKKTFGEVAIQIATLDHRYCVPFLGGCSKSPDGNEGSQHLQGPLTLYSFPNEKVTIVQQRSPIIKSRKHDFAQSLVKWIKKRGFAEVIILTSLDAGLRTDSQMRHPYWYYTQHDDSKDASPILLSMKTTLPKLQDAATTTSTLPAMPGGGLARLYLQEASSQSLPVHALITFAAEGDNRSDALAMALLISELLDNTRQHSLSGSMKEPRDWSLLFGSQINDSMFN